MNPQQEQFILSYEEKRDALIAEVKIENDKLAASKAEARVIEETKNQMLSDISTLEKETVKIKERNKVLSKQISEEVKSVELQLVAKRAELDFINTQVKLLGDIVKQANVDAVELAQVVKTSKETTNDVVTAVSSSTSTISGFIEKIQSVTSGIVRDATSITLEYKRALKEIESATNASEAKSRSVATREAALIKKNYVPGNE